ncbi:MAG: NADP-dependent oxidoreductase [Planctomycetaceae bacterium]|nr:NADP-dependent oxidoreductase [Planctomycetaceae bacterium]
MKVWQCDDSRPVPGLTPGTLENPVPGPGELLIRIHAVGVTPTELSWYPTTHTKTGENRQQAIPGHEFSGVVTATGSGLEDSLGSEVFGMNDWFADGATAEYCCTLPSMVAPKPVRLSHVAAASIPIAALTAWQGLFDRAKLQPGERVLIHGGSGAVGVLAIQLAHWHGAEVLTTARSSYRETLMKLGATRVIDYRNERFEEIAKGVDVVFDPVGGSILQKSWDILGPGGRLITIAASSEEPTDERTKRAFFIVESNREQLGKIASLLDSGKLHPVVRDVIPFDAARMAYFPSCLQEIGCGRKVITGSFTNQPQIEFQTPVYRIH